MMLGADTETVPEVEPLLTELRMLLHVGEVGSAGIQRKR